MHQRVKKDLQQPVASKVNSKQNEHTLPERAHEETSPKPLTPVRPNTPGPDPEREAMGGWMAGFVNQDQNIICERYKREINAANRQYEKYKRAIETALQKNDE
ncbi:hypothetical protein COCCADRAFT_1318 [Bipolaris zeicola 26-R-13]|uniref:Uncharacterized protein n=1 Tax=Cochliobolus carbonum (strain 26-R-13) TaxID=930089 RepID=W6YR23_COCC2|nr:uncharacterized protein COCCADRAFT_1318 [Bipolaris zeicola 26-R-13]EUC37874.1 hypothetical protein COCCADRAFT_1318 [Bipolaris zeicola 26-R-13]